VHAHADGTFAIDDAEARAYAKTWCPAPPAVIKSSYDAICARLWARTDVTGARKLVMACKPWACDLDMAQKPQAPGAAGGL
jgi:hypothetical protein